MGDGLGRRILTALSISRNVKGVGATGKAKVPIRGGDCTRHLPCVNYCVAAVSLDPAG